MNVDYVGWSGHGNLGDDACLQAIRRLCPRANIVQTRSPESPVCILGGGTLIHSEAFLEPCQLALRRRARLVVFGTGVDTSTPVDQWEPWRRSAWHDVLRQAAAVGVRGPHSAKALESLGLRGAQVIGDPALSVCGLRSEAHHDSRLVLVNLGSDFEPRGGRQRVAKAMDAVVEQLQREGCRVVYWALRADDLQQAQPLIERRQLPQIGPELNTALAALRWTHLVISLRLHGAVLAAGCGVPFISLGYRPKCQDFAASLGQPELCLATEHLSAATLSAAVARVLHDHQSLTAQLTVQCMQYRHRQRKMAAALVEELLGRIPSTP